RASPLGAVGSRIGHAGLGDIAAETVDAGPAVRCDLRPLQRSGHVRVATPVGIRLLPDRRAYHVRPRARAASTIRRATPTLPLPPPRVLAAPAAGLFRGARARAVRPAVRALPRRRRLAGAGPDHRIRLEPRTARRRGSGGRRAGRRIMANDSAGAASAVALD